MGNDMASYEAKHKLKFLCFATSAGFSEVEQTICFQLDVMW